MSLPQPIYIDHSVLNMYPDCAGPQHDERKAFLSVFPDWVTRCAIWLVGPKNFGWREGHRQIPPDALLHRTVYERFALGAVLIHGAMSPYRPRALRRHLDVSKFWATPERSATGQNSAVGEVNKSGSRRLAAGSSAQASIDTGNQRDKDNIRICEAVNQKLLNVLT